MANLNPANASGAGTVRWLSLIEALRRMGPAADPARAWDTLASRLRTGTVRARAAVLEHKIADDAPDVERDEQIREETWGHLRSSSLMDAAAGVVELRGSMPDDNRPLRVTLHGLEIVEDDVSDLLGVEAVMGRAPGRPPAAFWMHFAEELAVFIHEEGVPDRSVPVSRTIDRVLDRIAAQGRQIATPSYVRGVVTAALNRIQP